MFAPKYLFKRASIFLSLLFFLGNPLLSFSQNFSDKQQFQIDSLTNITLTSSSHDTSLAQAYLSLSELLYLSSLDTMAFLCKKTINIAEKAMKLTPSPKVTKSLLRSLAGALNNLGYFHDFHGEVDSALSYYHQSLSILEQLEDQEGIASAWNNIGVTYKKHGRTQEALKCYEKALDIHQQMGNQQEMAITLNNFSLIYHALGDVEQALEYQQKALKIREKLGDQGGIANSLNNLGVIYDSHNLVDQALEYYNKALNIQKKIGDKPQISTILNNIGFVYGLKGNLDKALKYNYLSLSIRKEINDKTGIATSLENIAGLYEKKLYNWLDISYHSDSIRAVGIKGLAYGEQSLDIYESISDDQGIANVLKKIGALHFVLGDIRKAEAHANRSLELSNELGFPNEISNAASLLSKIYAKKGQGLKALEMYKLKVLMHDSVQNERNQKAVYKQQARYEFDKKAALDSVAHANENRIKDAELARQKALIKKEELQLYWLYSGLFLVSIFSFVLYRGLRRRKKAIMLLRSKNSIILNQNIAIENQRDNIVSGIQYAKKIQMAILPSENTISQYLPHHFIYFRPKGIVSGDFYWFSHLNNKSIIAAIDCTGHGVPGAFITMIGNTVLNDVVNKENITDPATILNRLDQDIINALKTENTIRSVDGMDLSICVVDHQQNKVDFAGAKNHLIMICNSEIKKVKADLKSIGTLSKNKTDFSYTSTSIEVPSPTWFYLMSDGFSDQFGNENGVRKKFGNKRLRSLLLSVHSLSAEQQHQELSNQMDLWVDKQYDQIDDQLIIGFCIGK